MDLTQQVEFFKSKLLNRGYSKKYIEPIISTTLQRTRQETLNYRNKSKNRAPPLVLATRYNPVFQKLRKCLYKHWHLITENSDAKEIFPRPPMIAYRKHKNLKEYLTSAKI